MAGVVHTFTFGVKIPGLATLPADPSVLVIGDYAVEVEIDVAAGAVSQHVPVSTITKANVVSLVINADKAAMNVFTNAADGTGGQEFILTKNNSVSWNNQLTVSLFPNPMATSTITGFYINNPGSVAGIFRCAFLMVV